MPLVRSDDPPPVLGTPACPRCGKSMRLACVEPATPYINITQARYVCDCGENVRTLLADND